VLRLAWPDFRQERLDPSQESIAQRQAYTAPMYESLLAVKPLDGSPVPGLAERWETSADGLAWTFYLRKGVKFHNGDEMTAEDVKFSVEMFMSKRSKSAQRKRFARAIKSIEVVDPYTVRFNLNTPWPSIPWFFNPRGAAETTVLPKRYVEQVGWDGFEQKPIGTGPWKFSKREVGSFIEYEAVADHWRKAPEFQTLRATLIPEERTRVALLKNGEADIAPISVDTMKEIKAAGVEVVTIPLTTASRIQFWGTYLPESGPFHDIRVRKALNLAINREELAQALFPGAAQVAAFYPSDPKALGFPQDITPYPYDPEQAKALLAEAGYPNGFSFDLHSLAMPGVPAEQARRICEAVAGYWEKIGVKPKIVPTDIAWLRPRYRKKPQSPDIIGNASFFSTTVKNLAALDLFIFFQFDGGIVRLANNVDDLITKAVTAPTLEELKRYSEEAYRKLYNDYQGVPLFYLSVPYGVGPKVTNFLYSPGFESGMMFLEYVKHK